MAAAAAAAPRQQGCTAPGLQPPFAGAQRVRAQRRTTADARRSCACYAATSLSGRLGRRGWRTRGAARGGGHVPCGVRASHVHAPASIAACPSTHMHQTVHSWAPASKAHASKAHALHVKKCSMLRRGARCVHRSVQSTPCQPSTCAAARDQQTRTAACAVLHCSCVLHTPWLTLWQLGGQLQAVQAAHVQHACSGLTLVHLAIHAPPSPGFGSILLKHFPLPSTPQEPLSHVCALCTPCGFVETSIKPLLSLLLLHRPPEASRHTQPCLLAHTPGGAERTLQQEPCGSSALDALDAFWKECAICSGRILKGVCSPQLACFGRSVLTAAGAFRKEREHHSGRF